jgi:hypothetical protein
MTWQDNHITIKDWKRIGKNHLKDWIYKFKAPNRSLDINSYYWVCLEIIIDEYKNYWYIHTSWELHELFKKWLLPRVRVYWENKKSYVYQRQTTTNLSNKQFSKYLNDIKLLTEFWQLHKIPWLEEIAGFIIPEPIN